MTHDGSMPQPPQAYQPPPAPKQKKKRSKLLMLLGFLAVGVVGCTGLVAVVASGGSDTASSGDPVEDIAEAPESGDPDESDDSGDEQSEAAEQSDVEITGGTRDMPFAMGTLTTVQWDVLGDAGDSLWNTTVSEVRDMTDEVLATNDFNTPPPADTVFAGFDIEMTLVSAGKVPLSQGFNFNWEIVGGSTDAVYDPTTIETESFGCGVTPMSLDALDEVFIGGTVSGTVCIPIPAADVVDPETAVAMGFGERVFFASGGTSPAPVETPVVEDAFPAGEQNGGRQTPFAYDSPTPVEFDTLGDADGSVWTATISAPSDITEAVLAANQFNEAPPEGTVFVGFDVSLALDSAEVEPLSAGFNFTFEIIGGATAAVYNVTTIETTGFGCGAIDGQFDDFAEVFVGGAVEGTVCIPIPADDLAHPNTRVAIKFAADTRVYFGAS